MHIQKHVSIEINYLPPWFGVFTHSENSDKGPVPDLLLAATANLYMLFNASCLLKIQLVASPAISRFTNDSESTSGLSEQMIYWVIWDPPSLSGGVHSMVTCLLSSKLTIGHPGLPGFVISIDTHTGKQQKSLLSTLYQQFSNCRVDDTLSDMRSATE